VPASRRMRSPGLLGLREQVRPRRRASAQCAAQSSFRCSRWWRRLSLIASGAISRPTNAYVAPQESADPPGPLPPERSTHGDGHRGQTRSTVEAIRDRASLDTERRSDCVCIRRPDGAARQHPHRLRKLRPITPEGAGLALRARRPTEAADGSSQEHAAGEQGPAYDPRWDMEERRRNAVAPPSAFLESLDATVRASEMAVKITSAAAGHSVSADLDYIDPRFMRRLRLHSTGQA